jgi:hypothetical protein
MSSWATTKFSSRILLSCFSYFVFLEILLDVPSKSMKNHVTNGLKLRNESYRIWSRFACRNTSTLDKEQRFDMFAQLFLEFVLLASFLFTAHRPEPCHVCRLSSIILPAVDILKGLSWSAHLKTITCRISAVNVSYFYVRLQYLW